MHLSKEHIVLRMSQEVSGRWTVPILLALEASGGRFTPLQNQLSITPARLSNNLKQMAEAGLIQHLSPYERRHPLLPEYLLTEKGKLYREIARTIRSAEADIGHGALSAKAWNIPILLALHMGYDRFQDIRKTLQHATPRILSTRLDELNAEDLIRKQISEQPRPSFMYGLSAQTVKPVDRMAVDLFSLV